MSNTNTEQRKPLIRFGVVFDEDVAAEMGVSDKKEYSGFIYEPTHYEVELGPDCIFKENTLVGEIRQLTNGKKIVSIHSEDIETAKTLGGYIRDAFMPFYLTSSMEAEPDTPESLALNFKTAYGNGALIVSVDEEAGQATIQLRQPRGGDIIDLALVELRDSKDRCILSYERDNRDKFETDSVALRLFGDPATEDYTHSADMTVEDIMQACDGEMPVPDSALM